MQVTVEIADASQRDLVESLLQMYLHDLSEFSGVSVSDRGSYEYEYLDLYWTEDSRSAFLIRVAETLAGFALVRTLDRDVIEMAEFFVVRKYRGQGVGRVAAEALFSKFCGTWQVAQHLKNLPAQAFWRRVIGDYAYQKYTEVASRAKPPGTMQIFDSRKGDGES